MPHQTSQLDKINRDLDRARKGIPLALQEHIEASKQLTRAFTAAAIAINRSQQKPKKKRHD